MTLALEGLNVQEGVGVRLGTAIVHGRTAYLHPLDVIALQQPDLDAVGRILVLVDRRIAACLHELDAAMEVDW